ncbi:MAG TPA: hypothetical protein VFN31_02860 [Candidatus Saccharimonadales bacterium]|nr:hypothetical protein [Candidatus Saccharimonadales bacterium]
MPLVEPRDMFSAEAVQEWLIQEAANSTLNRNSPLDDLGQMRQTLINRSDPKISGHISRMENWLPLLEEVLTRRETESLIANISFGAMVFLSGTYRRQRIMQSTDQADYYERKKQWKHPGGVDIQSVMANYFADDRLLGITAEELNEVGEESIAVTKSSMTTIYNNVPKDFGAEQSTSVKCINNEQMAWCNFLSKSLTYASARLDLPVYKVPILEPKPITESSRTTLEELLLAPKYL